jgi:predicted regulator of Ras-like GTPase activity (Roadblock/LC7/MglB family)
MFHELLSRDREDGRATWQPQAVGSEAYLNGTSQGKLVLSLPKEHPRTPGFRLVEPTARREGRLYPRSQQVIHQTSGLKKGVSLEEKKASGLPKGRIIEYVLNRLFDRCPEIDAGIVANYEGLLLGSNVRGIDEPENIGAVSSLILENSTRIINELNQGRLTQLLVLGTNGFTLLKNIGEVAFLTVTSQSNEIKRTTYYSFLKAARAVEEIQDWLV